MSAKTNLFVLAQTVLALTLSSCAHLPTSIETKQKPPKRELAVKPAANWQALPNDLDSKTRSKTHSANVKQNWLADFQSEALINLVQDALRQNLDIQSVQANLRRAQAQNLSTQQLTKPSAVLGLNANRQNGTGNNALNSSRYQANISLNWEADVWGRLSAQQQAGQLELFAAQSDLAAAKFSLAANISKRWFAIIEARLQVKLAAQSALSYQQTLDSIQQRYFNGLSSALDLRLARNNLATGQNSLAIAKRESDALIRSMNSLLGRYPSNQLDTPDELPLIGKEIPVGLPATLLSRRIDIMAAEQRLQAAGLRLSQSKKNHLPSIKLNGSSGTSSQHLRDLLDFDNLIWNLFAGLTAPIFEKDRLKAEQLFAQADDQAAWLTYAKTVQTALEEVETALAANKFYAQQQTALLLAEQEAGKAAELASDRYQNGLENISTLLESKRRWFAAQSALLQLHRTRLNARVNLYLALGGSMAMPAQ